MAHIAHMIVAVVVISASLCVHSAPIDEMFYPRFSPDRDNYKEDRRIRSAPSAFPTNDNPEVVTEVIENAELRIRAETPSAPIQVNGVGLAKPSSGKVRRGAYWYPYWLEQGYWTPSPTEGSHFVYDSFLGKVRREAPNTPSSVTTPSSPQMVEAMKSH